MSQIHKPTDTRTDIQKQLDTLIDDITAYSKTAPSLPLPKYSGDPTKDQEIFNEYTQTISEHYTKLNSDFFSKFNTRIADTMNKLHNLHIMSDSQFEKDKVFYNFMPTAYNTYASGLIERLNTYKTALDDLESKLNEHK